MRRRIYFDYAASTPVDPEVERAMRPYFTKRFGNPGSLHSFGQEAVGAIDRARERIASVIGAEFGEVIFTSSATLANNIALRGVVRRSRITRPRIIISSIEHESIYETARDLEKEGAEVVTIKVGKEGVVNASDVARHINQRTVLISVMYVNNETGLLQPIADIAKEIKTLRGEQDYPMLHVDAAQAIQFLSCNVRELGVDLMTLSAHKIYGPKGIGALYMKRRDLLSPLITGGGQEFGLYSGTENVPLIVGFEKAIERVVDLREKEKKRISLLKQRFLENLLEVYSDIEVNGAPYSSEMKENRAIPSIINIYVPHCVAEQLLTLLDIYGIAASAGSACATRSVSPSRVLLAMGHGEDRVKRSIRFSFGRETTVSEIDTATSKIIMAMRRVAREIKRK